MRIGLVHGRFQPFHNGHKFLIDKMLVECHLGVVLVGSADKRDKENPFTLQQRQRMIVETYQIPVGDKRLRIGANVNLPKPDDRWDILFESCALSLTGCSLTDIYTGPNYAVLWPNRIMIHREARIKNVSGSLVRGLLRARGEVGDLAELVPLPSQRIISENWYQTLT